MNECDRREAKQKCHAHVERDQADDQEVEFSHIGRGHIGPRAGDPRDEHPDEQDGDNDSDIDQAKDRVREVRD